MFRFIDTKITGRKVIDALGNNPNDNAHRQVHEHICSMDIASVTLSVAIDMAIDDALRLQRLQIAEYLATYGADKNAASFAKKILANDF